MAYERQYYTNGDVLDARQMNHMETGIKENSDNIDKLSEENAELKSDLVNGSAFVPNWNKLATTNWKKHTSLNIANGEEFYDEIFITTDYISIKANKRYELYGHKDQVLINYYDSDKNFVSGRTYDPGYTELITPNNICYMLISYRITDRYNIFFNQNGNEAKEILDSITEEKEVYHVLYDDTMRDYLVDGCIRGDGEIEPAETSAYTTQFIKLDGLNNLFKNQNGTCSKYTNCIAFYDDKKQYISQNRSTSNSVPVPSNACYIRYDMNKEFVNVEYLKQLITSKIIKKECIEYDRSENVPTEIPLWIKYRYIFSTFNFQEEKLLIFGSNNGIDLFLVNSDTYTPTKGNKIVRDPSTVIIDDYFYITYSDTSWSDGDTIGMCRTKNFIDYEELDILSIGDNFKRVWAPSFFVYKNNIYIVFSGSESDINNFQTYIAKYNSLDHSVSNITKLNIGDITNTIDFHLYKNKDYFYAIGKDETQRSTVIAKSNNLTDDYTIIVNKHFSGRSEEGQYLIIKDDGTWRLYMDVYEDHYINAYDINDLNNIQSDLISHKIEIHNYDNYVSHLSIVDFREPYGYDKY